MTAKRKVVRETIPTPQEKRVCKQPGCGTILTRYNDSSYCYHCRDKRGDQRTRIMNERAKRAPDHVMSAKQYQDAWLRDRKYLESIGLEIEE